MANKTLMDTIRQKLEAPEQQAPTGGAMDQTERAQGLLRAKLGKAGAPTTGPRLSNIQEQQAAQQTRLGQKRLATEGAVRGQEITQQAEAIEAREQESLADLVSQREDVQQRFELQSENITQDLERNFKQLDDQKKAAKLEQLGFTLRLQDKDYLTNLQREGERAQLQNSLDFKEQLARDNFADMEDLLRSDIAYKKIADMSDREFRDELAQMDLEYAREMAHQARITEMKQAKYKMFGAGVSGGTQAYGSGMFSSSGGEANTSQSEGEAYGGPGGTGSAGGPAR